jgi:hypothetical protein
MTQAQVTYTPSGSAKRMRIFKLVFGPLLFFSLLGQIAVVWTQLDYIRGGYFDFVLYHSAARIVSDGKGSQLYDLGLQREYQKGSRVAPQTRDLPFNHLPYELLPLLPLANFSFTAAHLVWALVNFFLLVVTLVRLLPFVEASQRKLSCLMLFAFFPTLTTLKMGQDSVLTIYLLTEIFISLKNRRYSLAGSLLALGLYKPQFFLPIAALLLCRRQWSAVIGFALTALGLLMLSLVMVGPQGLMGLLALWLPMIDRGNVVWPELMLNLRGLAHMILSLAGMSAATNLVTLFLSMAVFWLTLRHWPKDIGAPDWPFNLRFALAVVMTALVSFHLYSYDGTLLALPLILMLNHFLETRQPSTTTQRVFLTLLIAMFLPVVPNILLSEAILAWWALPIPVLFWVIAAELRHQSQSRSAANRN